MIAISWNFIILFFPVVSSTWLKWKKGRCYAHLVLWLILFILYIVSLLVYVLSTFQSVQESSPHCSFLQQAFYLLLQVMILFSCLGLDLDLVMTTYVCMYSSHWSPVHHCSFYSMLFIFSPKWWSWPVTHPITNLTNCCLTYKISSLTRYH